MSQTLALIKVTVALYAACAKRATKGIILNWKILLAAAAAYLSIWLMGSLFLRFGLAGAFVMGVAELALLTLYYYWLTETYASRRLTWRQLFWFDTSLFISIVGVSFILWVIEWLAETLLHGLGVNWILACLRLALVVFLNALPEMLYVQRQENLPALRETALFIRENWVEWFIPLLFFLLPWFVLAPKEIPLLLAGTHPLLPATPIVQTPALCLPRQSGVLALLFGIVLLNWFMVFRAFLFEELRTGTRRKRLRQLA